MANMITLHDDLNDEQFEYVCDRFESKLDDLQSDLNDVQYEIVNAIYTSVVCLDEITKSELLTIKSIVSRDDVITILDRLLRKM